MEEQAYSLDFLGMGHKDVAKSSLLGLAQISLVRILFSATSVGESGVKLGMAA
jgi:hypothetical protein